MSISKLQRSFRIIAVIGLCLIFVYQGGAQEKDLTDLPTLDGWRGIRLNGATPDEVVKILGTPQKDKTAVDKKGTSSGWTVIENGKPICSILYKKIGHFGSAEFLFVENKLLGMNFLFRQTEKQGLIKSKSIAFQAVRLPELFQSDFLLIEKIPQNAKITAYEGQKEPTIPKVYPQFYSMLAIKNDSVIFVSVENSSLKGQWRDIIGKPTVEMFPGFAQRIIILSRP